MRDQRPAPATYVRVACVGGLDPGGQAGLAADVQMGTQLGALILPVCAARTWQSDARFAGAAATEPAELQQVLACLPAANALKTGMLGSLSTAQALVDWLRDQTLVTVVDPIAWSSSKGWLWQQDPPDAVRSWLVGALLPLAAAVTPNWPELAWLAGMGDGQHQPLRTLQDARDAAARLPCPVVLKGGHAPDAALLGVDWLIHNDAAVQLPPHPGWTGNRRGTGCRFATALAVGLAQGQRLHDAAASAGQAVAAAVRNGPQA